MPFALQRVGIVPGIPGAGARARLPRSTEVES